jgi:post-segregation antitoxin (ccd killing protein)
MRQPLYDPTAKKRTVSLTLNSDLYAKTKEAGINASQVAEAALAAALTSQRAENAYVEKHGSPAEMLRDYLSERDDAA